MSYVPGSEKFAFRGTGIAPDPEGFAMHHADPDVIDGLDPLTYEVIRHRLWAITTEMGSAMRRMSGSIVVSEINDFNVAILDERGDVVQFGLYNIQLSGSVDMAIKWTLENRVRNPGIRPGDMFLTNDPWVGGGNHQNDVTLMAPLFVDGELFGWTAAVAHQLDVGGVAPGSWSTQGRDVFWESLPLPPIRIVEGGVIREDIEDSYLRRSRVPPLVGLDLRAKIGAANIGSQLLLDLVRRYGAATVKAVMQRVMNDAEKRLRARLRSLPDGRWSAVAHQDSAREGDDGVYRVSLDMIKEDDRLILDFRGTDPEVEGFINCTLGGLRSGVVSAILPMLCGDIPWATGGLWNAIEICSDPGTVNDAAFPAGVGKGSVASAWATQNATIECISGLLDSSGDSTRRESATAVPCGAWDLAILAGIDQHERPFVAMIGDAMAAGGAARATHDGNDTGGLIGIPMGKIADVEMNEFQYPLLYLWRREEADSGGPGRFRGGVGASSCFTLHNAPEGALRLVVSQAGKALPQAVGVSGGSPANTSFDVLVRGSDTEQLLAAGKIPATLDDLQGVHQEMPAHLETNLADGDTYYMQWQGGGGYGEPLMRDPAAVLADFNAGVVTAGAVTEVYGVVTEGAEVAVDSTDRLRRTMLAARTDAESARERIAEGPRRAVDDNLARAASGAVFCIHCGTVVGDPDDQVAFARRITGPATDAGRQIVGTPASHTGRPVEFRQSVCPGCGVSLQVEVVPADDPRTRTARPHGGA